MGGSVDFKTALQMRLSVMKPRRQDVEQFLLEHPHKITPGRKWIERIEKLDSLYTLILNHYELGWRCLGIPELVTILRSQGKEVFLVSGGFRQIIHPLAESLDIPLSNVFANSIMFKVIISSQRVPLFFLSSYVWWWFTPIEREITTYVCLFNRHKLTSM